MATHANALRVHPESIRLLLLHFSLMASKGLAAVVTPRFRSAARKLSRKGVDALKPQKVTVVDRWGMEEEKWRRPSISRRKANVLRKEAISQGNYGSFDASTGIGWDPHWDLDLEKAKSKGSGRLRITPPKKAARQRNREERALKVEKNMADMDQKIDEYHLAKQQAKPPKTFENKYKAMTKL